jgi:hypothetical protein
MEPGNVNHVPVFRKKNLSCEQDTCSILYLHAGAFGRGFSFAGYRQNNSPPPMTDLIIVIGCVKIDKKSYYQKIVLSEEALTIMSARRVMELVI